ncbi:MAG: OmpA family protein [Bdellovibrionales bacterium]|nr:OmpA family protein [Bdellovibrionales bacterium]
MLVRTLISLLFTASFSLHANESRLALKPEVQRGDIRNPQGLWPLLGASMGLMDSGANVRSGGVPMHLKVIGSYYFDGTPWIADAGLGLHNEFLTQDGGGNDLIQSLYTEVAARYQFTNKWQLGAIWNTLVDNPDRYKSNTENLASFIGVQALKEFTWDEKYLVRAGGRVMTDVGIGGESINTIMGEVQVSFGDSQKVAVQPAPVIKSEPIAPHLARQAVQTFQIDPGPVNFESDSTRLVNTSQQYLRRLARALADNRQLFDRVEVIGHADQRGPHPYNKKLSENRAQTIANSLLAAGINKSQIRTVGKGKSELLTQSTSPTALARNRRVQLEFHGVKNQTALKNVIDSVSR